MHGDNAQNCLTGPEAALARHASESQQCVLQSFFSTILWLSFATEAKSEYALSVNRTGT